MEKDAKGPKAGKSSHKIKFPMHDVHMNKTLSNVKMACILALVAPFCLYLLHNVPQKLAYRNFYTNYDPLDAFDRMQSGGYLTSCPNEDKSKNKK